MSWFTYKDQNPKYRVGLELRVANIMQDHHHVRELISKNRRIGEAPTRIVVKEFQKDGHVTLEVWCRAEFDLRSVVLGMHRYTVFYITVPPNPDWICEGDMGRRFIKK